PFLNRPKELFSILNILQPTIWSSYWKFAHRYCDAKLDGFGHWNFDGATNLTELRTKLEHIMLRRTKQQVLTELPSITKNYLPYLNNDKRLITSYTDAMTIAKQTTGNIPNSKRFMQVRQAIGLMKVDAAIELAEDMLVDSGKIVLFAIHKAVVSQLESRLSKYGLIKIVGDVPQKERFDLVQKFQSDPDTRVAVISQAGGEGINLFAANTLVFVEREWNPGKEEQIMGRLHRIGQVNPVTVHYIIAKNTIDERIHKIIETKSAVLGQVYTFDDIPVYDLLDVGV
ncbi:DEAD/DEAH box helicase, partial [Candidatus Dojkabacteria bacterium]|nr:DEAD/DEAH box helicase [Candidatus Dojkabacteria bacterium]